MTRKSKDPDYAPIAHPTFKNVTSKNIFTSCGRVHGGDEIGVPLSEGEKTKGLELVQPELAKDPDPDKE